MKYTVNQPVKYRDDDKKWHNAAFSHVFTELTGCPGFLSRYVLSKNSGDTVLISSDRVKALHRITTEDNAYCDTRKFGEENLKKLMDLTKKAMRVIFPQFAEQVIRDNQEPHLLILSTGEISIVPTIVEIEHNDRFEEVFGWEVSRWIRTMGSKYEPPGWDCACLGSYRHMNYAVAAAIDAIYKILSENFWNCEADDAFYKELQDESSD